MVTHAARLANFEVHALWRKWCFQMSWEKLTSHSVMPCWFGRMLTCENSFDSKPQSKLFPSLFDKCHFTCLHCSRTFWKTTSKWFCKEKRNVRNIWKKSKQTTLVSVENILCLAIMVKETCASTIFNSILIGNLKVLENKKNARICIGVCAKKMIQTFCPTVS